MAKVNDVAHKIIKKSPTGIAENLKKLMERANIGEHELSRRTNIKQPIIHRLLSGTNQNPKLLTIKPIADYFMLTVSQLIGEQDIDTAWGGLTSKSHHGWVEVPISNYQQGSVVTEANASDSAFAFHIDDQSMEPLFPEGCLVIVEPKAEPLNGNYVIIKTLSSIILRNYFSIANEKYINPLNARFGTIQKISKSDKILGVVIRTIYDHRIK